MRPGDLTLDDLALKFPHCVRSWWGKGMLNLVEICTVVFSNIYEKKPLGEGPHGSPPLVQGT